AESRLRQLNSPSDRCLHSSHGRWQRSTRRPRNTGSWSCRPCGERQAPARNSAYPRFRRSKSRRPLGEESSVARTRSRPAAQVIEEQLGPPSTEDRLTLAEVIKPAGKGHLEKVPLAF